MLPVESIEPIQLNFEEQLREERAASNVPTLTELAAQQIFLFGNIPQALQLAPAELREKICNPKVIHVLPMLAKSHEIPDPERVFGRLNLHAHIDPRKNRFDDIFSKILFQKSTAQFYCQELASIVQQKKPGLIRKIRLRAELYDYNRYNLFQRIFTTLGKDIKNYYKEALFAIKLYLKPTMPRDREIADAVIQTRLVSRITFPLTSLALLTSAIALPIILGIMHVCGAVVVTAVALAKLAGLAALWTGVDTCLDFLTRTLMEALFSEHLRAFRPLAQTMHDKSFLENELGSGLNQLRSKVPLALITELERTVNQAAAGG